MNEPSAAFEAPCPTERMCEGGIGSEILVDGFFLLLGRALSEPMDNVRNIGWRVVHGVLVDTGMILKGLRCLYRKELLHVYRACRPNEWMHAAFTCQCQESFLLQDDVHLQRLLVSPMPDCHGREEKLVLGADRTVVHS